MLKAWPGNAHLHILWASLVQLQDDSAHGLDEAKQALQCAAELDCGSPAAAIELGCFLDNVEDDPQKALKVYANAVAAAPHLLIEGLIGQAKAYRQLDKSKDFLRCVEEIMLLTRLDVGTKRTKPSTNGHAEQIQKLLGELVAERSA